MTKWHHQHIKDLPFSEILQDTLRSTDPFSASEALVFCIGALKLLTGNATIVKQLVKKDCIENLAILLNSINKNVGHNFVNFENFPIQCNVYMYIRTMPIGFWKNWLPKI